VLHTFQAQSRRRSPRGATRLQRKMEGIVSVWKVEISTAVCAPAEGTWLSAPEGGDGKGRGARPFLTTAEGVSGLGPRQGGDGDPREGKSGEFGRTPRPVPGGAKARKHLGDKRA